MEQKQAVTDRRPGGRRPAGKPLPSTLGLPVAGRRLEVSAVLDVAQNGVGLQVGEELLPGTSVEVRFLNHQIDLRLVGTVVWSSRREQPTAAARGKPSWAVGVNLYSPGLLHTFL